MIDMSPIGHWLDFGKRTTTLCLQRTWLPCFSPILEDLHFHRARVHHAHPFIVSREYEYHPHETAVEDIQRIDALPAICSHQLCILLWLKMSLNPLREMGRPSFRLHESGTAAYQLAEDSMKLAPLVPRASQHCPLAPKVGACNVLFG
ncbi:hypothetical protein EYC84_004205 [Monilinia fructicola]|uniref:Uncharacterized protein n=1 Tax=Monilinia fructicola TaxID=38448 RepID=A0A5M9K2C9_MONFR|nr:hypothetical protein EYC84_004205 [Monilinia fructicola]